MTQRWLARLFSLYPPYLGAGIRVRAGDDGRSWEVRMPLRRTNRNYVGTHFGGSLYSMCDPFYMLILIDALGPGYVVWDKAATIRFRRPGRGTVSASFAISEDEIDSIRRRVDGGETVEPCYTARVLADDGTLVAEVEKLLYVRRKTAG